MRYEGCLHTTEESLALIDEVNHWCRRTGTNYLKLVTAARVAPSIRSMVRTKGKRVTFTVAGRLRAAMQQYRHGISSADHKARLVRPAIHTVQVERVNREPCPQCGIRVDIGCRHSQRFERQWARG